MGDGRAGDRHEVADHAHDGVAVEKLAVVLPDHRRLARSAFAAALLADQLLGLRRDDHVHVELGGAVRADPAADRQAGPEIELRHGRVVEAEHHLEKRIAADLALRPQLADQLLERHVLVLVGLDRHQADPPHHLGEGGRAAQVARASPPS